MISILSLFRDKRGVSSLEYAILAGIVISVITVALGNPGGSTGIALEIKTLFGNVSTQLTNAGG